MGAIWPRAVIRAFQDTRTSAKKLNAPPTVGKRRMNAEIEAARSLIRLLSLPSAEWPNLETTAKPVDILMGPSTGSPSEEWSNFAERMRAEHKNEDNSLSLQLERVRYSLEQIFKNNAKHFEWPDAPMRVAILLRKAGQAPLEAEFLERLTARLPSGAGARFEKLSQRAALARKLADKTR